MPRLNGDDEVVGEFKAKYSPIMIFCLEMKAEQQFNVSVQETIHPLVRYSVQTAFKQTFILKKNGQ